MAALWIIGEAHAGFADAIQWLQSHASCEFFAEPRAAMHELHTTRSSLPLALIFLQTRSGQFRESEVEQLYSAAPLTPLVCLSGPWCEGESRSGHPIAGVTRIPWRAWRQRLPRELAHALHGNGSPKRLPRTASDTERIEASLAGNTNGGRFGGTAVVCTANWASFEAIAAMLGQLGMTARWHRALGSSPPLQGDVLICNGRDQIPSNHEFVQTPMLLLLDFPRPDDEARVGSDGIAAIVAQPLLWADFAAALGKALGNGRRPPGDTMGG